MQKFKLDTSSGIGFLQKKGNVYSHLGNNCMHILHQQHVYAYKKKKHELINVQRDKYYCTYGIYTINIKSEGNKNPYNSKLACVVLGIQISATIPPTSMH
jgi:hypothetical protein